MKKRAEEIFQREANLIINASSPQEAQPSMEKLIALAGILDAMGATADADYVDSFTKEAASIWDFILGGGGAALTTKDEKGNWFGENLLKAFQSGEWSKILSKDVLLPVVTHALMGGAVSVMTGAILDKLGEEFPKLSMLKDSTVVRTAISGALGYAITNSHFAEHLTDGIVMQLKKLFGMLSGEAPASNDNVPAQPAKPVTVPGQPVAQQPTTSEEGSDSQNFKIAPPVKG